MPPPRINYHLVDEALKYYNTLGYRYVEVPWLISDEALRVTLPPDRVGLRTQYGALVGSAEQGFIQMMLDNELISGRCVAAGPCFRDEPVVDDLHQLTFFKVELIEVATMPIRDANRRIKDMADEAWVFFTSTWGIAERHAEIVLTPDGLDIEVNGIEVGSYGYRSYKDFHWIYGTGLALPRLSLAASRRHSSV